MRGRSPSEDPVRKPNRRGLATLSAGWKKQGTLLTTVRRICCSVGACRRQRHATARAPQDDRTEGDHRTLAQFRLAAVTNRSCVGWELEHRLGTIPDELDRSSRRFKRGWSFLAALSARVADLADTAFQ